MKKLLHCLLLTAAALAARAQAPLCPGDPPRNPFVANTPWPMPHRNPSAQASTCYPGPVATDQTTARYLRTPQGNTSTWLYYSEPYSRQNGQRAILGSSSSHMFKVVDDSRGLRVVDSLPLLNPPNRTSWNHMLLRRHQWFGFENPLGLNATRVFWVTDQDTTDLYSPLRRTISRTLPANIGTVNSFNVTYDGWITLNTTSGFFGVLSPDFQQLVTVQLPLDPGEISFHNNCPVAPDNTMFIVTTKRLLKLRWANPSLTVEWQAPYDFIGDGPTIASAAGSGTTPTLVGFGPGQDELVVMCDGHNQNNLVAFWRNQPPADFTPLPGQDPRLASITPLPGFRYLGGIFQSVENSPTARGYGIACAQYNGFTQSCQTAKGVAKCEWDPATNTMRLAWLRSDINMNGVLTYSEGTNQVYSSGREADCNYYFYGLDWATGATRTRVQLGTASGFNDQGCNTSIGDDNTLYYGSENGLVQLRYRPAGPLAVAPPGRAPAFAAFPNPASHVLTLQPGPTLAGATFELRTLTGQLVARRTAVPAAGLSWDVGALPRGVYLLGPAAGPAFAPPVRVVLGAD